jgi:diguanylate cyclase (GGDEF)-like protein/PAS domain S-box-containing protein
MSFAEDFRHSSTLVAIMRVADGTILDCNRALTETLGYEREALIGRRPIDLDLWPDRDARAKIWGRLRGEGRVVGLPVSMRARDGRVLGVRIDAEIYQADGEALVFALLRPEAEQGADPDHRLDDPGSYRSLFLAAAEGIYRSLPGGSFIDVNPAMAHIFGFDSPAQMLAGLVGDNIGLYADTARGEQVRGQLMSEGRIADARSQVRRRDGSTIWISENARAVRDAAGQVLFFEGTVVDITDRLAAEAALRQSETLYKVLVDHCRDGVFLIQRGRVRFANRALADMLGYAPEELADFEYMHLVAPEERAAQLARRQQRESGSREMQSYEIQLLRKDGSRRRFAVLADAVDYEGDIASTGVMRDVTEERERLQRIEEAERKYRELFAHSPVGLFQSAFDGRITAMNDRLAHMLGYANAAELLRLAPGMPDLYVDESERPRVVREILDSGRVEARPIRVRHRDGSERWVALSARIEHDSDGRPAYFDGSMQDITERHQAELALRQSEAKYRTLVEHSQVGVFILRGNHYTYVNRTFAAMLGYSEAELCSIPFERLVAPEVLPSAEGRLRALARNEAIASDYESCYLHRDGSRVWVTVSIGPVELDGVRHMTGTVRDITRQRQVEQRLRFNAAHDSLTGLCNRLSFQQRLDEVLRHALERRDFRYAVLFLDLDGFKLVNDSLGHAAGDRLLVSIAHQLAERLQGRALVARYGGDEFTILPNPPCDAADATLLAREVLALFATTFDIGEHEIFSGASVGIVLGRPEYVAPDQVMRDADTAMYRAKAGGKAGYTIFDEDMHRAARERFRLETDLRLGLERGEFRVFYQPIVDLSDGRILGCEALMRWQHPEFGLIGPPRFLQVAEEIGLITRLDWWAFGVACAQVADWRRRLASANALRLNLNLDERQFARAGIELQLAGLLEDSGLPASCVSLEVTETVFRGGGGLAEQVLARLKALGVGLVVDDFGTGYSSLDSFAASPFDALKVDRNFIRDMETNPRHRAIVRTIIGFAEDLGLSLTAEGVETTAQAGMLRELGCTQGQGFLYSPAMPAEQFEALLQAGYARAA